jgi:hypothetical protein
MMNRIFDPEEPIDLKVEVNAADGTPDPAGAMPAIPGQPDPLQRSVPGEAADPDAPLRRGAIRNRQGQTARTGSGSLRKAAVPARRADDRILLISALAGVCMLSVAGSLVYFGTWNRLQQSLSQERNLLLVERLRSLGPANPSPIQAPGTAQPPQASSADAGSGKDGGLPPPPEEPWIQQLSSLPSPAPSSSPVLRVPLSPRLTAPAPATAEPRPSGPATPRSSGPLPQLLGVVGGPGRPPSAIFMIGGNSINVGPGEGIGSSGWRLRSADGETALIERNGEQRQVSIASGNGP